MKARRIAAFAVGLLFAVGLGVAGMTRPSKVTGFLDVTGAWDPSLAFVMGAALAVGFAAQPLVKRLAHPLFDVKFHVPAKTPVDAKLLAGAAVFGVGWGLGGYCPGPAVVTAASGAAQALVFTLAMLGGIAAFAWLSRRESSPSARDDG